MQPSHGPVILDLIGYTVTDEERELLQHPHVGGVILFARHFESAAQISELCQSIRRCRQSPLLITVDQEGGRVQRFKEGFVKLPSMGEIGQIYHRSNEEGLQLAECVGWLMAAELLAVGVDLSFAPVLDLDKKCNTVVGDRSFGQDADSVALLGNAVMQGMHKAGMAATGKHFPGHGTVNVDSHLSLPVDDRCFEDVFQDDMQPFISLIANGIDALMPAHILFPKIDNQPVGFSTRWLTDVLRKKLLFSGVIFSDDLNMAGAELAGNYAVRAKAALDAGCDAVLICNNRAGAIEILEDLPETYVFPADKFNRLQGRFSHHLKSLHSSVEWQNYFNLRYRKLYETQY